MRNEFKQVLEGMSDHPAGQHAFLAGVSLAMATLCGILILNESDIEGALEEVKRLYQEAEASVR